MPNNRPTGQHFVQEAFLKNFCDTNGKLQAHHARSKDGNTLELKWIENTPDGLAKEQNIYTVYDQQGSPYRIEDEHLAIKIEPPGMAAITQIIADRPDLIGPTTMEGLAPYIAHAAVRVPAALKLKQVMEPEMKAGRIVGEPIHPGAQGIPDEAAAIERKLNGFKFYAKFFDGRERTLLATSDRPVGLYAHAEPDRQTKRMLQPSPIDSSHPDCWNSDVVCTFPISTQCTLLGIKGTKGKLNDILKRDLSLNSHELLAGWLNAMTAFNANWVYARSRDVQFLSLDKIRKLVGIADFIAETTEYIKSNYADWPPT
jgi:Protein of unknown function (DUF4238)